MFRVKYGPTTKLQKKRDNLLFSAKSFLSEYKPSVYEAEQVVQKNRAERVGFVRAFSGMLPGALRRCAAGRQSCKTVGHSLFLSTGCRAEIFLLSNRPKRAENDPFHEKYRARACDFIPQSCPDRKKLLFLFVIWRVVPRGGRRSDADPRAQSVL